MELVFAFIDVLSMVAEHSTIDKLVVAAFLVAPLLPAAALVIKPCLALRAASVTLVICAICVAFEVSRFQRLTWSDRVFFGTIVWFVPIFFAWLLGLVVFVTKRWIKKG
jgi:hypothetical protein